MQSWTKTVSESRVQDNCTHGGEVIGQVGRLKGPGLIFIEDGADLSEVRIVKLLLTTGNPELVLPEAPIPFIELTSFMASCDTSRPQGRRNILRRQRTSGEQRNWVQAAVIRPECRTCRRKHLENVYDFCELQTGAACWFPDDAPFREIKRKPKATTFLS